MRTRCPVCNTVFRVTSEQLRVKAGKVRCGHCQSLFNAFDSLIDDAPEIAPKESQPVADAADSSPSAPPPADSGPDLVQAPATAEATGEPPTAATPQLSNEVEPPADAAAQPAPEPPPLEPAPEEPAPTPAAPSPAIEPAAAEESTAPTNDDGPANLSQESVEESTLAAREAGLVAARELAETPAYNRWAAGTLSAGTAGLFDAEATRPARWPFTLSALLLLLALLAQLTHHFRSELVLHLPASAALFEALAVDVPLPRKTELVSIESSDLQSDNSRGLLVLQATLRNRAPFAQAWPALELTLTDTRDGVVARRVLAAADYLPPGTDPKAFVANGEIAVRLWVEAKELGAAGYRLYLFYP